MPAEIFGLDILEYAFKITIYLPIISVGLSLAILWMIGGKKSLKKGFVPAVLSGLAIALSALALAWINYSSGREIVSIKIIGIIAGMMSMGVVYLYDKRTRKRHASKDVLEDKDASSRPSAKKMLTAISPWIILTILVSIISIPSLSQALADLPGSLEVIKFFDSPDPTRPVAIDLNILTQIYTWIAIALVASFIFIKPKKEHLKSAFGVWKKRMWGPFLAYSLFFSIAFVMDWSAKELVGGVLQNSKYFFDYNINMVVGSFLADIFGSGYIFVAAALGFFGAIVAGSETSSNVMFYKIQENALINTGVEGAGSPPAGPAMTVLASHAVAGGVASAITPAKISNAVSTLGESSEMESIVMRKHMGIAVLLTIIIGVMTGIFVSLAI